MIEVEQPSQGLRALDPYKTLQVHPHASRELISEAYWLLVRRAKQAAVNGPGADARIAELNDAYCLLLDERRRAEFDAGHPVARQKRSEVHLQRQGPGLFALRPAAYSLLVDHDDYYELLGVDRDAGADILELAMTLLILHASGTDIEDVLFRELVEEAYTTLSDVNLRREHNALLPPVVDSWSATPDLRKTPHESMASLNGNGQKSVAPAAGAAPAMPPASAPDQPSVVEPAVEGSEDLLARTGTLPAGEPATITEIAPMVDAASKFDSLTTDDAAALDPAAVVDDTAPSVVAPDSVPSDSTVPQDAIPASGAPGLLQRLRSRVAASGWRPDVSRTFRSASPAPITSLDAQAEVAAAQRPVAGAPLGRGLSRLLHAQPKADRHDRDVSHSWHRGKKHADVNDATIEAEQNRLLTLRTDSRPSASRPPEPHPLQDGHRELEPTARITFTAGARSGEEIVLPPHAVTIGSAPASEIRIGDGDGGVSGEHARITQLGSRFVFRQVNGGGTLIGGMPLTMPVVVLDDGDEIEIGSHRLRFNRIASPGMEEAPAPR